MIMVTNIIGQLRLLNFIQGPDDMIIFISGDGESSNLLEGINFANNMSISVLLV